MAARYEIGQRVVIAPVSPQHYTPRDADIEGYVGQSGKVIDYYWVTMRRGEVFYIYCVEIGDKEITLHEDEISPYIE